MFLNVLLKLDQLGLVGFEFLFPAVAFHCLAVLCLLMVVSLGQRLVLLGKLVAAQLPIAETQEFGVPSIVISFLLFPATNRRSCPEGCLMAQVPDPKRSTLYGYRFGTKVCSSKGGRM